MRRLFTTADFLATGKSERQLHWLVKKGGCVGAAHGVYADGPDPVDPLTAAAARVPAANSFAAGLLGGTLHECDGVDAPSQYNRGEANSSPGRS